MAEGEAGGAGGAAGAGQPDAVLLAPLSEDTFLHNLHVRYKRDIIYTYVGNALVSVNPCRPLPLYSADLVRSYLARPPYQLPPHVYALAATAYRWVRDRNESQCIVVTGESGAGKTEAARVCLQCAVVAAGPAGTGAALTAAGTLLEAFGNAATSRNHNASRFGKLLEIEFDFKGEPVGGHITHYLLEKERAYNVCEGERNFHVLYQLLAGADVQLLKRLKLQRSWEQYRILRGATPPAPHASPRRAPPAPLAAAQHDTDHFAFTKAAMATLGLGGGECGAVLRLLAFILKLGNVQFEPQHNIDGSIGTRINHLYELREACALVGVDAAALAEALAAPAHPPHLPADHHCLNTDEESVCEASGGGGGGGEAGEESEGECGEYGGEAEWARAALDRLVGTLYSRLFTWLVQRANAALRARGGAAGGGGGGGGRAALALLDVYGLESLAYNSLDRLLINYAAERVQAAVTAATLRREQEEYLREGLPWRALPYRELETAELLDAGPESVVGALRDAALRGASDRALLLRLQRRRHPRLHVAPPHAFTIAHFGCAVTYSARGMVCKNRDALCRRCGAVVGGARDALLAELFAAECGAGGGAPPSPRRPAALACRQRALVAALVRRLPPAPRLVRCLRADALLRPHRFDAHLLRQQIRTQGILEMALLRRAGWCESMCARAVLSRYGVLASRTPSAASPAPPSVSPAPLAASPAPLRDDPVRAARALLRTLPIPSAEFAYGRTRVFIRSPRTVWELEALRAARVAALVVVAQRAWRRHRQRRAPAAQAVIARAWRAHRARGAPARAGAGAPAAATCVRAWAARAVWRWWCAAARRRYLRGLWARLPARHRSPACGAWPPPPAPRLLARTDALLRRLHHAWRCREYRAAFDQTARNRMREKVTASALFRGRKATYAASVAHPFVGDYVRLRASAAWRRGPGAAAAADRYVVFADVAGKVARASGRVARCLCVVSTAALLVLEARSLRVKRRVPAHLVYRLSLSPHADDVLVVHVRPHPHPLADAAACEARDALDAPGCLFGGEGARRRRGDVVLRTCHVLELATKLFLVVQNAVGAPPHVNISTEFEANFGAQVVTVAFHTLGALGEEAGEGGAGVGARVLRRADRMDVLL